MKTGVSYLVLAPYHYDEATDKVTYGEGAITARMAEYKVAVEVEDDNKCYLDNQVAETAPGRMKSAELTVSTGEFDSKMSKMLLSAKEITETVGSKEIKGVAYDDDMISSPVGAGLIEEHVFHGEYFYRAFLFPKTAFSIPAGAASTRGESIDWQTQELTGTIMRSDQKETDETPPLHHPWQKFWDCESESQALSLLKQVLNVTEASS
ncbi:hypothetical protein [Dubosiella newyorkensis]|uniref:hypothetical protein n=1 Tax=Dubosiella newyorkensis TaxID=1862672 RepID=UPI00272E7CB0|nr:hypothetical protein [Dubosiella newyorkensis]